MRNTTAFDVLHAHCHMDVLRGHRNGLRVSLRVRGTGGTPKELGCPGRHGRTRWRVPRARTRCRAPRWRALRRPPSVGGLGSGWPPCLPAWGGACCVAPPPPSPCGLLPPRRGGCLSGKAQMCLHLLRCLPFAEPHPLLPPPLHGPNYLPLLQPLWVRHPHRWACGCPSPPFLPLTPLWLSLP